MLLVLQTRSILLFRNDALLRGLPRQMEGSYGGTMSSVLWCKLHFRIPSAEWNTTKVCHLSDVHARTLKKD
jgi:hypothetical protein